MERNGLEKEGRKLLERIIKQLGRQMSRVLEVKIAAVTSSVPYTSANANQVPNPVSAQFRYLYTWGLTIMYLDNWEG